MSDNLAVRVPEIARAVFNEAIKRNGWKYISDQEDRSLSSPYNGYRLFILGAGEVGLCSNTMNYEQISLEEALELKNTNMKVCNDKYAVFIKDDYIEIGCVKVSKEVVLELKRRIESPLKDEADRFILIKSKSKTIRIDGLEDAIGYEELNEICSLMEKQ